MASITQDLSISGENVQRLYNFYIASRFVVNRRYQRKLVWSVEEKRSFIDSLIKSYPTPIILLAERAQDSERQFEIIDGMQRLNAIVSFIEGEFEYESGYFNLETMAESKDLLDKNKLQQRMPSLSRDLCLRLASYNVALSVYRFEKQTDVDEVFRRINANGRVLSAQELRAAGALGNFAQLVRRISTSLRGDVTATDILALNDMKQISISNRNLPLYGIDVEEIFWVKQGVLTKDMVRESRDEELVADLLSHMVYPDPQPSRIEVFDAYFGVGVNEKTNAARFREVEEAVSKIGPETLEHQFLHTFNILRTVLEASGKSFASLILAGEKGRFPRYFQVVFLALFDVLIRNEKELSNIKVLVKKLENSGAGIKIPSGGGTWSAESKTDEIARMKGLIQIAFRKRKSEDPALDSWVTQFENILIQSRTEQTLYDFKVGLVRADSEKFDDGTFSKVVKTLTAIHNHGPHTSGYVIVGVGTPPLMRGKPAGPVREFNGFKIPGVQRDIAALRLDEDKYFTLINNKLRAEPISDEFKTLLSRKVRFVHYHGVPVLVFKVESGSEPVTYGDKYYGRNLSNTEELVGSAHADLFKRFLAP